MVINLEIQLNSSYYEQKFSIVFFFLLNYQQCCFIPTNYYRETHACSLTCHTLDSKSFNPKGPRNYGRITWTPNYLNQKSDDSEFFYERMALQASVQLMAIRKQETLYYLTDQNYCKCACVICCMKNRNIRSFADNAKNLMFYFHEHVNIRLNLLRYITCFKCN